MKQLQKTKLILLLVIFLICFLSNAQDYPEEITADAKKGTLKVDANVFDCGYKYFSGINKNGISEGDNDISGSWFALWDDEGLYVVCNIIDDFYDWGEDDLKDDRTGFKGNPWEYDNIEVYINPTGERNVDDSSYESANASQIRFNPVDGTKDYNNTATGYAADYLDDLRWVSQEVPGGYVFEALIPWEAFLPDPTTIPYKIGFTINVNDSDQPGGNREAILMWVGADMEALQLNSINYFGILNLISAEACGCEYVYSNSINLYTNPEDENANSLLNLFPNPVTNYVYINSPICDNYKIEIYDMLGRKLLSKQIMNNEKIDVTSLNKGSYIIKFYNNNSSISKSFIIK